MKIRFDGERKIDVGLMGCAVRFNYLIKSYKLDGNSPNAEVFNSNLTAYERACMVTIGVLFSSENVFGHTENEMGDIVSGLYAALKKDLDEMKAESGGKNQVGGKYD